MRWALLAVTACTAEPKTTHAIEPGVGIGAVRLGATYAEVSAALGRVSALPGNGLFFAQYRDVGLEVVFTSPDPARLVDDARVLGVSAVGGARLDAGARPGLSRDAIVSALGPPTESSGKYLWWSVGVGVELTSDIATRVAVFSPYTLQPVAPPMEPAR